MLTVLRSSSTGTALMDSRVAMSSLWEMRPPSQLAQSPKFRPILALVTSFLH